MPLPRTVAPRRESTRTRVLVVAAALAIGPGCSYAYVRGPRATALQGGERADAEWIAQTCTSSNAAPIVDTVLGTLVSAIGGVALVAGVGAAVESGKPQPVGPTWFAFAPPTAGELAAVIGIGAAVTAVGGVLLGSAVTGFGRTADCRQAIERSVPKRLRRRSPPLHRERFSLKP